MDFFEGLFKKVKNSKKTDEPEGEPYEFCPKCDANLTLQNISGTYARLWRNI